MRAFVLTGFGGPEMLQYRDDVPAPSVGPGEVRVRVTAAGLNNTDIWTREGRYGSGRDTAVAAGWRREPLEFPRIQGADVVGEVDEVGDGVPAARIGERVVIDPMLYTGGEHDMLSAELLGSERDGGFAEYVTVPAANAHAVASPLSDAELATFPTACLTAYRMLDRARLAPGETLLVTGASGGVGSALLQLARARGSDVVAVVGAGKEDRARRLGAVATVRRGEPDLPAAVHGSLGGRPIDVVADVVGGPNFGGLLTLLRPLGRYVTSGAIAGPVVEADLRTVYLRQLELIGSSVGTHEQFAAVLAHVTAGDLEPLLAGAYPLQELHRAQADFAAKEFFGKLVVCP